MMIGEGFKQVEAKYAGTKFPNCGYKVTITIDQRPIGGEVFTAEYRNVTEIHYNFKSMMVGPRTGQVAFESDIHRTGMVWEIGKVVEFEAVLETDIAEDF